jgi:hypothetical protein
MAPRIWTTTGWFLVIATAVLFIVACAWDWHTGYQYTACADHGPGPAVGGAEVGAGACVPPDSGYAGALVCVMIAAVTLPSAVACFFWGAHRRAMADLASLLDAAGSRS